MGSTIVDDEKYDEVSSGQSELSGIEQDSEMTPIEDLQNSEQQVPASVSQTNGQSTGSLPNVDANALSWSKINLPVLKDYTKKPSLFDRDKTLFLTADFINQNRNKKTVDSGYEGYPLKNSDILTFDGAPALRHSVKKGEGVMGIQFYKEWPRVNDFRAVMVRYQVYYTNYREFGGKQITIEGGRGYIGKGYRDGWSTFGRSSNAGS